MIQVTYTFSIPNAFVTPLVEAVREVLDVAGI
ncbi:hypothetical protein LCGC14_0378410 [marine sediment metagenome]|uniref:Uncharacterized protein n=1 Tax=marine sediment metagenome TaxID=412755 RepID=A0A0F9WBP0_9ZZZZ